MVGEEFSNSFRMGVGVCGAALRGLEFGQLQLVERRHRGVLADLDQPGEPFPAFVGSPTVAVVRTVRPRSASVTISASAVCASRLPPRTVRVAYRFLPVKATSPENQESHSEEWL